MDTSILLGFLFCIIMAAFFSAAETAFSTVNKTKLKILIDKGGKQQKRAELALNLAENYDKLISTILIGSNIVNISAASLGAVFFLALSPTNGATISTVVVTLISIIFCEISPKSIAKDIPEQFVMFFAPLVKFLITIFSPLNFIFSQWKKLLSKIFNVEADDSISSEELLTLVDEIQEDGNLDAEDGELIKKAIAFNEHKAENIITHRIDVTGVSINDTKEHIAKVFEESQFSRLVVYENTIDNIIGILHLKDFFSSDGITKKNIKDILVEPVFVREYEHINDILKKLQAKKSHIAVITDEFGGTQGIITMEDILEELVGEIWDESDEVVEDFEKVNDNTYHVNCLINVEDFYEFFNIDSESESQWLSGWVIEQLGKVPKINDGFSYDNLDVVVLKTDGHRILKIKVVQKNIA